MLLGVGVDLLNRARLVSLFSRKPPSRLARRVLGPVEMGEFSKLSNDTERTNYLATRWTIKEATYKALYPHEVLTWKEVCVSKHMGKPVVALIDSQRAQKYNMHVSLSHDGESIIAFVVAERINPPS